jgi:hypothetical protein
VTESPRPLDVLAAHGFPVSDIPPEQQEVLDDLSPVEVELLIDIKNRLDEVGPEVVAHSEIAGAALF